MASEPQKLSIKEWKKQIEPKFGEWLEKQDDFDKFAKCCQALNVTSIGGILKEYPHKSDFLNKYESLGNLPPCIGETVQFYIDFDKDFWKICMFFQCI